MDELADYRRRVKRWSRSTEMARKAGIASGMAPNRGRFQKGDPRASHGAFNRVLCSICGRSIGINVKTRHEKICSSGATK